MSRCFEAFSLISVSSSVICIQFSGSTWNSIGWLQSSGISSHDSDGSNRTDHLAHWWFIFSSSLLGWESQAHSKLGQTLNACIFMWFNNFGVCFFRSLSLTEDQNVIQGQVAPRAAPFDLPSCSSTPPFAFWTLSDTFGISGISWELFCSFWTPSFCHCSLWMNPSTPSTLPWQWMLGLQSFTGSQTSSSLSLLATWRFLTCKVKRNSCNFKPFLLASFAAACSLQWVPHFVHLRKGTLVQNHKRIALHYARTWLLPDLIVTVIDLVLELLRLNIGSHGMMLLQEKWRLRIQGIRPQNLDVAEVLQLWRNWSCQHAGFATSEALPRKRRKKRFVWPSEAEVRPFDVVFIIFSVQAN